MFEPTQFAESNALLAIQAEEFDDAEVILFGMLPGKLARLAEVADELAQMARDAIPTAERLAAEGGDQA
jgi:hypothetical protein